MPDEPNDFDERAVTYVVAATFGGFLVLFVIIPALWSWIGGF